MSDIKKFLLRLPDVLYDQLEAEAIALNTSLNKLIVERLRDSQGSVPASHRAIEQARSIAVALPNTMSASDIPSPERIPCVRCGEKKDVIQWGTGFRCQSCAVNFS